MHSSSQVIAATHTRIRLRILPIARAKGCRGATAPPVMPLVATTGDHADADDSAYGVHEDSSLDQTRQETNEITISFMIDEIAAPALRWPPSYTLTLTP